MEKYDVTDKQSQVLGDDLPEGMKVVGIGGYEAARLADLSLHRDNLSFALECIKALSECPDEDKFYRRVLWRSAVMHFLKCFSDSAKFRLCPETVYESSPIKYYENFLFFKSLHNKYLAHDDKSHMQNMPGAIINAGNKDYQVESIVCYSIFSDTLDPANFENLEQLTETAKEWIDTEYEVLSACIALRLEKEPYSKLAARDEVKRTELIDVY